MMQPTTTNTTTDYRGCRHRRADGKCDIDGLPCDEACWYFELGMG